MELQILKNDGSVGKSLQVLDEVFKVEVNKQAIYDVVNAKRASLRQGTHSTLTKAEVAGGGRKPFKQKHTGRARAGSIRSSIWVGGGISFGPKPTRNYNHKVNKKVVKLAMKSILSMKVENKELFIVEPFVMAKPSTKDAIALLAKFNIDAKKKILIVNNDPNFVKSVSNIKNVKTTNLPTLDAIKAMSCDILIMSQEDVEKLQEVLK